MISARAAANSQPAGCANTDRSASAFHSGRLAAVAIHRQAAPASQAGLRAWTFTRTPGIRRAAASRAQATHQQTQPDHSVWLMKCAPRNCCAIPSTIPAATAAASQPRASAGRVLRNAKYPPTNAKPADAWPAGKHRPLPPSRCVNASQCCMPWLAYRATPPNSDMSQGQLVPLNDLSVLTASAAASVVAASCSRPRHADGAQPAPGPPHAQAQRQRQGPRKASPTVVQHVCQQPAVTQGKTLGVTPPARQRHVQPRGVPCQQGQRQSGRGQRKGPVGCSCHGA
jgi:hypothetical protein